MRPDLFCYFSSRKRKTLKGAETEPTPLEEHSVQELLTAIDQQIDQQENVETFMDTAEEVSEEAAKKLTKLTTLIVLGICTTFAGGEVDSRRRDH